MNEFTACANGRFEEGKPHDFDDFEGSLGGPALMYCRRCGEVRRLAPPLEEEGRTRVSTITVTNDVDPTAVANTARFDTGGRS